MPQVVAKLHPFTDKQTFWEVRSGTSVARVVVDLMDKLPRGCKIVTFLNDLLITTEEQLKLRLKKNDTLSLRITPANKPSFKTAAGFTLGAAALTMGWFLNRSSSQQTTDGISIYNNTMAPPPPPPPEPPPEPIQGIGGAKEAIVPQIAGIANRKNNYGPYPRVYGTHRVYPVIVADPYVLLEGADQYLYCVLSCGYGELDISEIKIGKKAITEFTGLQYEVKYGTGSDTDITIYTSDVDEKQINETLPFNQNLEKRAGQTADKLSVDIIFPNGLFSVDSQGNKTTTTHQSRIEYRKVGDTGAWTIAGYIVATESTSQPLRRNLTWATPSRDLYDIRIFNQTPNGNGTTLVNAVQWLVLRSIIFAPPVRPVRDAAGNVSPMTYIAIKVKASDLANGTLDELNCICKSKLRYHNGTSWQTPALTRNPAWIFADMVTGTFFGRQLGDSYLDTTRLKEWADFCDSKGLTFDFVYDSPLTIQEALKQVASAGRASVTPADGKISVIIDKPRTVETQLFCADNTSDFSVRRIYPEVPHAIRVRFVNPTGDWQMDERVVFDDGYNENNASKYETLEAVGCTDSNMAYKIGRYQLAVAQLRPRIYQLTCDAQHMVCNRGDLARLNYDVSMQGLGSGLVKSVTLDGSNNQTAIRLDDKVTMEAGKAYFARVRLATGALALYQVTNVPGTSNLLTWLTPIPAATTPKPAKGDLVVFGEVNRDSAEVLIDAIEHNFSDMSARLTFVDYSPAIYTADTGSIPEFNSALSIEHPVHVTVPQPVIYSMQSDESVLFRNGDGTLITRIQVSLTPPVSQVQFVEWQYRVTGTEEWSVRENASAAGNVFYVLGVEDGVTYDLRCRYVTQGGRASEWTNSVPHLVIGKTTPPPDVTTIFIQEDVLGVGNDLVKPLDWYCLRWKVNQGDSTNWTQATLLGDYVGNLISRQILPPGPVTVLVKSVDVAGNESTNAGFVRLDFGDSPSNNLLSAFQVDQHPTFPGTISGGSVVSGELKADDTGGTFWGADSAFFWSGNDSDIFWHDSYGEMVYTFTYTPGFDIAKPFKILLQWAITAENFKVEYRGSGSSLFWAGLDTDTFWDLDAALFWGNDDGWQLYPVDGIQGAWQQYEFRITCYASNVLQSVISSLSLLIDVPTMVEYVNDVVISDTGTRIPLTNTYRQITSCVVSLEEDPAYPDAFTARSVDKSITGPLVYVRDVGNVLVEGKVDAIVRGF